MEQVQKIYEPIFRHRIRGDASGCMLIERSLMINDPDFRNRNNYACLSVWMVLLSLAAGIIIANIPAAHASGTGETESGGTRDTEIPAAAKDRAPDASQDLMSILELARHNDPAFQSERLRHGASPERIRQAYSELLPFVSADGYYQQTRQKVYQTDVAVYDTENVDYPSYGYNVNLKQSVFRYTSFLQLSLAKMEVKRADLQFEQALQDLMLRVADAYIGILGAQDSLAFARAEEETLTRHFSLARERYQSGLAPLTDLHDAKARLAYTTATRINAETRLDDAYEALMEITGEEIPRLARFKHALLERDAHTLPGASIDAPMTKSEIPDAMPLVGPDPDDSHKWIQAAFEQNLDVQIQRNAVNLAKREIDLQQGGRWPVLELTGRLNREDQGGSLFGGGSDLETMEAVVQMNIPLYQGGYVSSKVREARKLYLAAKQDLEREIRRARRITKAAFLGIRSAIENVGALEQSVISSQIALEAKQEGYRSGLLPSLVVIDAERDVFRAKREYVQAQYEYLLNGLRLKRAVGTLEPADLAAINQWLE